MLFVYGLYILGVTGYAEVGPMDPEDDGIGEGVEDMAEYGGAI
jgi:hypothetical protein